MFQRAFLTIIPLLLTTTMWGQRCGFTDTVAIGNFGTTPVTINIEDYLNNDLGNPGQGLCEVSLYFQHSYVYDFTVTLTSPAGQSIDLVGPINNQTRPPTSIARWFVDFERCDSIAAPDGFAPPTWNNNNFFNWPAFGVFTGDYFPATGCLEDLNIGPVNGDWTVSFTTDRPGEQGRLTYLLLTFCDDANADGPCCFADAGELRTDPEILACEQSDDLPFDYAPRYRRPRPDTALYDYTYAIVRNDSVLFTQDEINLRNLPAGDYEICGLSYREGELGNLVLDGSLSPDDLRADFAAVNPAFCGDLTPVCQLVRLSPIPDTTFLAEVVCIGGEVEVGGMIYNTTDRHITIIPAFAGCDSVVVLDLLVVDVLRADASTTICAEDVFVQGTNVYNQSGVYVDTIPSVLGCDSIVTLTLTLMPAIVKDTLAAVCIGGSYMIGSEGFSVQGGYTRTLTAANGCDSTVNLSLIVLDPQIQFGAHHSALTCDLPNTFLNAADSDLAFTQSVRWLNDLGDTLRNDLAFTADTGGVYIFELEVGTRGVTCVVRDTIVLPDLGFEVGLDLALTQVQCTGTMEQCAVINCRNPAVGLRVNPNPLGPAYTYSWAAPPGGNIVGPADGPEIVVDEPGSYAVSVRDPATGCRKDTFFTVGLDILEPLVTVTGNQLINCDSPEITLLADTMQARRAELDFEWTGDCLLGPVTGPLLTLSCAGNVTLTVTNRTNGCARDTTFAVLRNLAPVNLSLAPAAAALNCYAPTQTLAPVFVSNPSDAEYAWTRTSSPDTIGFNPELDIFAPGTYQLIAIDSISRCADTVNVVILGDTTRPVAISGPIELTLNCYQPDTILGSDQTSQGFQFEYTWTRQDTPLDTIGTTTMLPVEPPPGLYRLAVFNVDNGCRAMDSTLVRVALDTPFIRIDLPLDFDCFIDSVLVDASLTNLGYPNEQSWSGFCLPDNLDTNRIAAFCPGTYVYSVLNTETGCAAKDSIEVLLANNSVVAVLPDSAFLDCDTGQTRLDRRLGTDAPVVRWFRDGVEAPLTGMQPFVTIPGEYVLVLGNFNESCLDTARTTVVANCPVFPIIVPPDSLTCINTFVVLDARPSVPAVGSGEPFEWIIPVGAVTVPGASDRELLVLTPGTFGFAIENTVSGDRDTFFIEVIQNTTLPIAEAGPRDTISCYEPFAELDGSASTMGDEFDYLWTTTNGDSLGNTPMLSIPQSGSYLLTVTHRFTGCQDIDNVFVFRNTGTPDLAFTSGNIPCDTVDFELAVIPDEMGDYTYAWDGTAILANAANDTVRISATGDYSVTVTNLNNGCEVVDMITTNQLPCPPFPALRDSTLTCVSDTIFLAATFRDPCTNCTYRWERNGNALAGEFDSIVPAYRTGEYRIIVVNGFGLIGDATATVSDARIVPEDNAGDNQTLTCTVTSVELGNDAPEPVFPYTYQWIDPAGNPIAGATTDSLVVSTDGLYQLTTTNTFSLCTIVDSVVVIYDTIRPISVAGPERLLDCNNKIRTLDGIESSLGFRYAYQWRSQFNELCLEEATTLNPFARCGGRYDLEVTDIVNGCTATSSTFVDVDDELPSIIPLRDTTVDCANEFILLVGREITGDNRAFGWEEVLPGGNVSIPEQSPGIIEVDAAGTFRFLVTDTISGCSNEFTVEVGADLLAPTAEAGITDTFFCALDNLILNGEGNSATGEELAYSWTSFTGFFIQDADAEVATVFQPDTYYFEVMDPSNSCTALDSVIISRDVEAPVARAGRDTTLTCSRRRVRLDGGGETLSGQAQYLWTTDDGIIVGGSQTLMPLVAQAGRYQLNIIDPINDCAGADIVLVTEDTILPLAIITLPEGDLLNCFRPELPISGENSVVIGNATSFEWSGPGGSLPALGEQLIDQSGGYLLTVINDRNDCRDTATTIIQENFTPPATPIFPPLSLTCVRDSIVLVPFVGEPASAFTFRWMDNANLELGTDTEQTVFAVGSYFLEAFDTRNGCRDTSQTAVLENRIRPVVSLAQPEVLNCFRTLAAIDGTASSSGGDFDLVWSSPDNTATTTADPYIIGGSVPGLHYLTVTNNINGCTTTDSVELLQSAIAVDELSFDVIQPSCLRDPTGDLLVLGVTGGAPPFRYRLDEGLLTDRLFYGDLPVGTYDFEVVGSDGCSELVTIDIFPGPEEEVHLRSDTIIRLGDSIPLTFFTDLINWDTLIWTSSGPLPAWTSNGPITVRPLVSQNYRLQVVGADGCTATDAVVIQVDETVSSYVPTAFSPNGDMTNEVIRPFVGPQVAEIATFKIYDRWGELMYDMAADPGRGTEDFGWNGRHRGKLMNSQVFVWEMELILVDDSRIVEFGDFILQR
jgi:gliding motility-associated-like protein